MRLQSIAFTTAIAATLMLSACGGKDDETTPAESTASAPATESAAPAMDAGAPAMDAGAPAMDAGAPAMEAAAPAMEAAVTGAITLDDIVGLWAETADACATDAMTIGPDAIAVGDSACIVTGTEEGADGLSVTLLCPVEGAEPEAATWTVTGTGDAPFTAITITMGDITTNFVRCAATE